MPPGRLTDVMIAVINIDYERHYSEPAPGAPQDCDVFSPVPIIETLNPRRILDISD